MSDLPALVVFGSLSTDLARSAHLSFGREQVLTLRSCDVTRIVQGQIVIPLLREYAAELAPDRRALTKAVIA